MMYAECSYRTVRSVRTNCPLPALEWKEKFSKESFSFQTPTAFQCGPRHTSQQVYNWFNTSEKPEVKLSDQALYATKQVRPGKIPQLTPEEIAGGSQVLWGS